MNGKLAKKIRKAVKGDYSELFDAINHARLGLRLKLAWKTIFRKL